MRILILSLLGMLLSSCGEGGSLSRSKAESLIEERWNKSGDFPTVSVQVEKQYFVPPEGEYRYDSVCLTLMERGGHPGGFLPYRQPGGRWKNWAAADEAGFLTSTAVVYAYRDLGRPREAILCTFDLTEKATPYILKQERGVVTLQAVESVDVSVTGFTKPADLMGQTVSEVEYTYEFELNPLGEALATPVRSLSAQPEEERTPQRRSAYFRLFDDGWRLGGD